MTEPKWLDARELKVWKGFLELSTILNRRVEQQLKHDAGLSHSQYEVLTRLSAADAGELRMTELAGVALTSKSGLTYQVAQLEKAGPDRAGMQQRLSELHELPRQRPQIQPFAGHGRRFISGFRGEPFPVPIPVLLTGQSRSPLVHQQTPSSCTQESQTPGSSRTTITTRGGRWSSACLNARSRFK